MAFESLTDRLAGVFKKLRGHGKLTEADIKAAMRNNRWYPKYHIASNGGRCSRSEGLRCRR